MPLLFVLGCACFVSGLSIRIMDPLVPAVALDLATSQANVSLLATAYAIPYALVQPVLGPVGDRIGKAKVIKICLFLLAVASALAAVAPSIEVMLAARVIGGLAGGGIIPLAIALVGDNVAMERRQIALSQILTAMIFAVLAGTIGTGIGASLIGWRGILTVIALLVVAVFVLAMVALPSSERSSTPSRSGSMLFAGYDRVLANPLAYVCYIAVFVEGVLILGLLPYVATLLVGRGAGGVFEAALVLAGMAIGGLFYTQVATRFIGRMGGVANLIRLGGFFAAAGFFGIAWQGSWVFEMAAFALLGFGFYSIHNSLQTQATELAPDNRGAAVSLHAFFFFLGQSAGPVFYAIVLAFGAPSQVISVIAIVALFLSFMLARLIRSN